MHEWRAQDGKFFVPATECGAEACELNQLKNRKTRGCTVLELLANTALRPVSPEQLLHYDVTTRSCETLAHAHVMW